MQSISVGNLKLIGLRIKHGRLSASASLAVVSSLLSLSIGGGVNAQETSSKSFTAKGIKIHYLEAGKGTPVVLVHGLNSSAEINWKLPGLIAELAKDHQVIALDLPGHGRSDKPSGSEAYGIQMVEDTALLLDHLGIKKAHIVGYSLGGMVTAKFLAVHPERALSGTLGGMGWFREGSGLQKVWGQMHTREGGRTPAALVHSVGQLALSETELKSIKVPVRILVGNRDPVKMMYVNPLEKVRMDWKVVTIQDAGHFDCIMKKQFKSELSAWIASQPK